MALISPAGFESSENAVVDIIAVPAIGADPGSTWMHQWFSELNKTIPNANILLYDHLNPEERSIEVKPRSDRGHKASAEKYAATHLRLSEFGIEEWTARFLNLLHKNRAVKQHLRRSVLFICHSTGGIVVKNALIGHDATKSEPNLAAVCTGIMFFATPHHGSSVLSRPDLSLAVKDCLKLKWEMSNYLCEQFSLENSLLEVINRKFSSVSLAIKIWNFVETQNTMLEALSSAGSGETLTSLDFCVVEERSATISTLDVLIEDEDVVKLNTSHVETALFANDNIVQKRYCEVLKTFIDSTSAEKRATHQALITSIMTEVRVDVHQFHKSDVVSNGTALEVWSGRTSLKDFFEQGPTACLNERLQPTPEDQAGAIKLAIPAVKVDDISQPPSPTITIDTPIIVPSKVPGTRVPTANKDLKVGTGTSNLAAPPVLWGHSSRPSSVDGLTTISGKTTSLTTFDDPRPLRARTYQAPTRSQDRFKWVHVPYTHAGWVPGVLASIARDRNNINLHKPLLSNQMWMNHHNPSRHASSHARFVRASCKILHPKARSRHYQYDGLSSASDHIQLAVYLPYLHWDSFARLKARSETLQERASRPHAHPVPTEIVKGKSIEDKLIWQYYNSNPPIHIRRTLDQFGYPSLRNTSVRDADQVLYKRTRRTDESRVFKEASGQGLPLKNINTLLNALRLTGSGTSNVRTTVDATAKVLMVDQLWLWVLDSETVVSFASPKEKEDKDAGGQQLEGDILARIYNDVNGDYAKPCDDCFDFAALVVFHSVKALLDHTDSPDLQVFRIFEEYISDLTEQQTKSFKEFRDNHRVQSLEFDVRNLPKYLDDNRDDLDAVLELRDIQDELSTIDKLLSEQLSCISEMITQYQNLGSKGESGMCFLEDAHQTVKGYEQQTHNMLKGAGAAQEAFEKLLDMKQKQANILEAHLARNQTEVAAEQSRAVMIFTIFTIIFLPLSFFASVFGMNSREWSGVETNPTLPTILKYMGVISLAVIVVALLVAFNKTSRWIMQKVWHKIGNPIQKIIGKIPSRRLHSFTRSRDLEEGRLEVSAEKSRRKSSMVWCESYDDKRWEEQ